MLLLVKVTYSSLPVGKTDLSDRLSKTLAVNVHGDTEPLGLSAPKVQGTSESL